MDRAPYRAFFGTDVGEDFSSELAALQAARLVTVVSRGFEAGAKSSAS